jgi:hypothetical protein
VFEVEQVDFHRVSAVLAPLWMVSPMRQDDSPSPPWRPDWPTAIWFLPLTTGIAAPVVARATNGPAYSHKISASAWLMVSITVLLTAFFTYAFSRRWGRQRLTAALIAGLLAFFPVFLLTAFFALLDSPPTE